MPDQSLIDDFFTLGYVVIDLGLEDRLTDGIIHDTLALYPPEVDGHYHHGTRIQDAWNQSGFVKELALLPVILETLEALFLHQTLPFQTLNYPTGTEQYSGPRLSDNKLRW